LDLATEELRAKLLPASRKLKDFEKERSERRKVRKKTKQVVSPVPESIPLASGSVVSTGDVEMIDAAAVDAAVVAQPAVDSPDPKGKEKDSTDGIDDEFALRQREAEEFSNLIHEDVKNDIGASSTGLYDLVGE